ncbi:MAG: hypothetical protein IKD37_07245 [Clostridia bacterium]|nr:hypothetical protein [Clostridia bacterium]
MNKKLLVSLLLAALTVCTPLTGCGQQPPSSPETTDASTAETSAAPTNSASPEANAPASETKPYTPVTIQMSEDPKLLYNGIRLPDVWPPDNIESGNRSELPVPYLKDADEGGYHPTVVDIDVGRQLFVDDFLIESTTLTSTHHQAVKYEGNPLFETKSHVKHGGLFYDAEKGVYELFYMGSGRKLMYLTSPDGITWDKSKAYPVLYTPKGSGYTSVVKNEHPDSSNPRYLCLIRYSNGIWDNLQPKHKDHEHFPTIIYASDDGQRWRLISEFGPTSGDATSMIYNPFRNTWIFSLRMSYPTIKRARDYVETTDILDVLDYSALDRVFWLRADSKDLRDESQPTYPTELYSISAIAYESIMLGAFQLFLGPENAEANTTGIPKITNINLGYSRDGFHYSRDGREPIIESSKAAGTWDRGYLHHFNNVCIIVGDELRFYYAGYAGDESKGGNPESTAGSMANCYMGFATMRRDGFVSLDGTGEVITRTMRFDEVNDRLFINAKAKSIRAEIRDANGKALPGFSLDECVPFSGDSTCTELKFTSGADLGDLQGKDFSIRFVVEEGEFYAFWVSDTEDGDSGGFLAAGSVEQ